MKKERFEIFLTLILALSIATIDCKDEGIAPVNNTSPGRRDYTWQIDTISTPETMLKSIDGISNDNVWSVSSAGDFRYTIFHFDGTKWSTDGVRRSLSPSSVYVSDSNSVWIVGSQGDVWHYDGSSWQPQARLAADSASYWSLEDIDAITPDELYVTGLRQYQNYDLHPLIYRFSSGTWTELKTRDVMCSLYKIRVLSSGLSFILGLKAATAGTQADTNKIFVFDGQILREIYSAPSSIGLLPDIARVQGGILILAGENLHFFDGNNERQILNLSGSKFGGVVAGRSANDIFLGMSDGVAHYNGVDIEYLFKYATGPLHGYVVFKPLTDCVFVVVFDYDKNLNFVYRGYLR